jgi:hypothetical protein
VAQLDATDCVDAHAVRRPRALSRPENAARQHIDLPTVQIVDDLEGIRALTLRRVPRRPPRLERTKAPAAPTGAALGLGLNRRHAARREISRG